MSRLRSLFGLALVIVAAIPLVAAPRFDSTIRLATQAPTGTMWHKELTNLGATADKDTNHRVKFIVYPDGAQGEETSTIRKMRTGSLESALLTAGGLSHIDKAFNVFTIPFFFENDEEEMAVQKKLEPLLEQKLQAKGFHLLGWGTGGWVQIFSKKPIRTLADMKAANLYVDKDDDEMVQWYTRNGFHAKASTLAEIAPALKLPNGIIDTTPDTPYLALMTQIFNNAKYMLDLHIAPFVGATVITTTAWNQLSADDKTKLTDAARVMETRVRSQGPQQDAESIAGMKARGLTIITPDAKAAADFRAAASALAATMAGGMVPDDVYKLALQERDAARAKK